MGKNNRNKGQRGRRGRQGRMGGGGGDCQRLGLDSHPPANPQGLWGASWMLALALAAAALGSFLLRLLCRC